MCASAFFASLENRKFSDVKQGMWLRRPVHTWVDCSHASLCARSACPFLIFHVGLFPVPLKKYLERGTLFYCRRLCVASSSGGSEQEVYMAIELQIKDAAVQKGTRLTKVIGLLSAIELVKLMDDISLKPNPRSPNINKITKAITKTLETDPDLLQYKTKGILTAGQILAQKGNVWTIDFTTPIYGGVLDGGHNFFAIMRVLVIDAVRHKYNSNRAEDNRRRKDVEKIKSWRDLTERWLTYGSDVRTLLESLGRLSSLAVGQNKLAKKMSFLLPIEVISPSVGVLDREVQEIIHEISVARNNNVQLKDIAIAQHKGSYELLKHILPDDINSKVQWKSGENQCPIAPTKIVPLALLPLKKLEDSMVLKKLSDIINATGEANDEEDETSFPPVKLISMYTSTAGCVSVYSQVIDAVANLQESGGDRDGIVESVIESLNVIRDLPTLWDSLEYSFENLFSLAVSGNEKKYAELPCNNKGAAKKETPTRFYSKQIPKGKFIARAGFVTPLFMSICSSFLAYDTEDRKVKWIVPPDAIMHEFQLPSQPCREMMREYVSLIKVMDYDPSKFGKSPMSYEAFAKYERFRNWVDYVKRG